MTTNHRIIVTIKPEGLVKAVPNPLLAEGEGRFRPGDRVTWYFTGLGDGQLPLVVFHHEEAGDDDDPWGPFETLAVSKRRIVGSGDSGHANPPLFYDVLIIDPDSPVGPPLIKLAWTNALPEDRNFGGLEPPKIPPD